MLNAEAVFVDVKEIEYPRVKEESEGETRRQRGGAERTVKSFGK